MKTRVLLNSLLFWRTFWREQSPREKNEFVQKKKVPKFKKKKEKKRKIKKKKKSKRGAGHQQPTEEVNDTFFLKKRQDVIPSQIICFNWESILSQSERRHSERTRTINRKRGVRTELK
ncbi:hypothetical protein CEXT_801371 [Caerostris extrusa]|uniref:Uncharacterized protein n=1 Tax=Caerostris extrusa TaxID=172846 RepID=A0AAV4NQ34_CAEEX|nr:hypothetical protein CEXT_801371 [Caerostris extrusa]